MIDTPAGGRSASPVGVRPVRLGRVTAAIPVAQLRAARMVSLQLATRERRTPLEVAEWFGALQAQDVASGHWSLGVRCPGATESTVLESFERGDIVRTWPMRGTIHVVPARDVSWMLDLMGPRVLASSARRRASLGLTLRDAERAAEALATELGTARVLTRAEAVATIAAAGIDVTGQRAYHLLWYAAQLGITCIGPQRGGDQTFVLLADWAPDQVKMTQADALVELFFRYVRSHGPVGLRDFAGWTGLTLTDTRRAAGGNAGRLVPLRTDTGELWATTDLSARLRGKDLPSHSVVALPGYDEFVLGFKDRSLQLAPGSFERVVPGGNGVFRATVVADGLAVATWKRTLGPRRVTVEVEPLVTTLDLATLDAVLAPYGHFLSRQVEVRRAG